MKIEKTVATLVTRWRDRLGISPRWAFHICLYASKKDTPKSKRHLAAWIVNDSAYLRSWLHINLWQEEAKRDLESLITHELIHTRLDRIDIALRESLGKKFEGLYNEMMESLTEDLERAFEATRKKVSRKPRKV
jgi:hypothetical protein